MTGRATPYFFELSREALSDGQLAFVASAWAALRRRRQYVIDASQAPRGSA